MNDIAQTNSAFYLEDLRVGQRFSSGTHALDEAQIKTFARQFDPQPFHLDEEAAKQTVFKGLAASGWHTAAIAMNLAVQVRPFGPHPLLGAGVDDLRWLKPVRPGDTLHLETERGEERFYNNRRARDDQAADDG